ncbi:hypothetical protein I308_102018 [Cryptococcus tetragattii IND107]|uniref:Splicing factor subunit n=1 Tax=Cryptococcus tetragattii IND107 TaxID=1296105 RepID=A0ABR3BW74_9TREE
MSSELRYTANTQLEQLHARYTGTGHADTTKYEWLTHQHRDTLASIARERFEVTEKMLQPCGKPPGKTEE